MTDARLHLLYRAKPGINKGLFHQGEVKAKAVLSVAEQEVTAAGMDAAEA